MSDVYTVIVKIRLCNIASIINGCILLKEKKLPESRSIVVNLSCIIRLAKTLFGAHTCRNIAGYKSITITNFTYILHITK